MRYARSEGTVLGALRIHVNPLVVTRGVGELVDALLRDLGPFAVPERPSNGLVQLRRILEDCGHTVVSPFVST